MKMEPRRWPWLAMLNSIVLSLLWAMVGAVALITYGFGWGERFSERVNSLTTMKEFHDTVGRPVNVCTNWDGTVTWDYTHWWSATAKVYFYTNERLYRVFTE